MTKAAGRFQEHFVCRRWNGKHWRGRIRSSMSRTKKVDKAITNSDMENRCQRSGRRPADPFSFCASMWHWRTGEHTMISGSKRQCWGGFLRSEDRSVLSYRGYSGNTKRWGGTKRKYHGRCTALQPFMVEWMVNACVGENLAICTDTSRLPKNRLPMVLKLLDVFHLLDISWEDRGIFLLLYRSDMCKMTWGCKFTFFPFISTIALASAVAGAKWGERVVFISTSSFAFIVSIQLKTIRECHHYCKQL